MKRSVILVLGLLLLTAFVPTASADHLLCRVTWYGECLEHVEPGYSGPGEDLSDPFCIHFGIAYCPQEMVPGLPGPDDLPVPDGLPGPDDIPDPNNLTDDVPAPNNLTDGLPGPDDLPGLGNLTDDLPGPDDVPLPNDLPGPDDVPLPNDLPDLGDVPLPGDDGFPHPDDLGELPGIGIPPGIFPLPIPDPSDDIPDPPFTFPVGRCFGPQYDLATQVVCIAGTPFITIQELRDWLGR